MELRSLLYLAVDVGEWSASRLGRFTLGNLLNRSLGGSQSPAGFSAEDTSPCSNLNENWNCLH